jgi:alkanesulfonate monooxygenase SsuD/methylene tetrahydromethanopterin reductase-like flavin-dependent oxidoreductase (luciferase family)
MILPRINEGGAPLTAEFFSTAAERIERFGFHSAWITDSIGRGFANPEPLIALAVAAGRTTRIDLGISILQVSIRNAVDLAHRVMTAHLFLGDRLLLGVGAGSTVADFEATGSDFESRFKRFNHDLGVMRRLWVGESVDGVDLTPFISTIGGPPVLIGSWGGGVWIPRAAEQYDGWIGSARKTNWETLELGIRRYREAGGTRAVVTNVVVDPEIKDVPDTQDGELVPSGLGTFAERLRRFRDLGFDEVVVRAPDHTDAHMQRIVDVVSTVTELRP